MACELYIKNMVCGRCLKSVDAILRSVGLHPLSLKLGYAVTEENLDAEQKQQLCHVLESAGFELLNDKKEQLVERIKIEVLAYVRDNRKYSGRKLSDVLSSRLHADYSTLSKTFSSSEGVTIEHFYIAQRVEMAKELLSYGELSLAEIAWKLGYSSAAYLSSQFKKIAGETPTSFKESNCARHPLDKIL